MIRKSTDIACVTFSIRIYQLLLNAYPAKFQQEYGADMMQVFQDCCLRAVRQGGGNGMARLWAVTLYDMVQSVVSEHAQKEIEMKKKMKPQDIRMAGGALIAGAVTLALSSTSEQVMGFLLSMMLLAGGVLGLRERYGEQVGMFGKNILLIGVILGSLTSLAGLLGAVVDPYWILIPGGPAVLSICLALFGIVALYKQPLSRWNILPLLAGVWLPIFFVPALIETFKGNWYPETANVAIPLIILQCVALSILGYVLISDTPDETEPSPYK
jgi:hypothetical protein